MCHKNHPDGEKPSIIYGCHIWQTTCFVYSKCLYRFNDENRRVKRGDLEYWLLAVPMTLIFPLWMVAGMVYICWAKAFQVVFTGCDGTSCVAYALKGILAFFFGFCILVVLLLPLIEIPLLTVLAGAPGWYFCIIQRMPIEY